MLAALVAAELSPLMELEHDRVGAAINLAREHDTYRNLTTGARWALNSRVVLGYVALAAGRRRGN